MNNLEKFSMGPEGEREDVDFEALRESIKNALTEKIGAIVSHLDALIKYETEGEKDLVLELKQTFREELEKRNKQMARDLIQLPETEQNKFTRHSQDIDGYLNRFENEENKKDVVRELLNFYPRIEM